MNHVTPFFECDFCGKKLTTELRLAKHNCENKRRYEFLQTMKGKAAYYCYNTWMSLQGRKADIEIFQNSKYYNSIVEFVKFCNQVGIPDRKHYIEYMIDNGIMPTAWTNISVYEKYIEYYDNTKLPEEVALITATTIFDLAQILECKSSDVFNHMNTSDIMKLVVARKLSPWILLLSPGFKSHLRNETTPEQRIMVSGVIDHKIWNRKFSENPEVVNTMRRIVKEFRL